MTMRVNFAGDVTWTWRKCPEVHYGPVGLCIYCASVPPNTKLTDEHIIPLALGGELVLDAASCEACASETSKFELKCCRDTFQALRIHADLPTRRPKRRPTHMEVLNGTHPDTAIPTQVSAGDAPGCVVFPEFDIPGLLRLEQPTGKVMLLGWHVYGTTADADLRTQRLQAGGMDGALTLGNISLDAFGRLIAKIAHGAAIALKGQGSFSPLLTDVILGRSQGNIYHYVGGSPRSMPVNGDDHQLSSWLQTIDGVNYLMVDVRLFARMQSPPPQYTAVVGIVSGDQIGKWAN